MIDGGRRRDKRERPRGLIMGTAVGDALGLPGEGIGPGRAARLFPGRPRHRLLPLPGGGRGMVSDDTEHTVFVAQCLLAHPDDPAAFARRLGWCLRWWLVGLPAGVGWATLRAVLRLWIGMPPDRSGVWSAGNGPAMRVAAIGAVFEDDPDRILPFVRAATRITHTDPRALTGALAVARTAARSVRGDGPTGDWIEALRRESDDSEWRHAVAAMERGLAAGRSVVEFAGDLGLEAGVTGYVFHTVPVALYAWARHFGDFESTVTAVLKAGGDTDTVGAIAGALAGAGVGEAGIPADWRTGILEWPRSLPVFREIADRLASGPDPGREPVAYPVIGVVPRNLLFLTVILLHGFRRLLPPYGGAGRKGAR